VSRRLRTLILTERMSWRLMVREVARARRAGEPLAFIGKGNRVRRLMKRLHETYPGVIWWVDAGTKERTAIVGWDARTAIAFRLSPARRPSLGQDSSDVLSRSA
jgi:hypothetical protein